MKYSYLETRSRRVNTSFIIISIGYRLKSIWNGRWKSSQSYSCKKLRCTGPWFLDTSPKIHQKLSKITLSWISKKEKKIFFLDKINFGLLLGFEIEMPFWCYNLSWGLGGRVPPKSQAYPLVISCDRIWTLNPGINDVGKVRDVVVPNVSKHL